MTTSCTDKDHPYYKQISKLNPKNRVNFFLENKCKRMKYVSLGEALDFICAGAAMNCVYWSQDSKGLVKFISSWMDAQEPRIEWAHIPVEGTKGAYTIEEKKREYQYLWNKFSKDFDLENLPWIDYQECPRDKSHKGTFKNGKIVRCAHVENHFYKPSFLQENGTYPDEHSGFLRTNFIQVRPDYFSVDNEGYDNILTESEKRGLELWALEDASERVVDPCYAIISDKGSYLPLETILNRINVNQSLGGEGSLFPFSGFTIASYAKAWYNQPGEKILFASPGRMDRYKVIKNFQPISSED